MNKLNWKRIYEKTEEADGFRVFVDRLWARGMKKEDAKIDYWAKEITPAKELREDYHKGRIDFDKFLQIIKSELLSKNVTMVFASKTPEISHIPILKKYLENKL